MARIIVVGPHPDDQELGMGGTIARLARQGHRVLLLDMTNGEPTPLGSPEARAAETAAATRVLSPDPAAHPGGVPLTRALLGLPNRSVEHTLEARRLAAGAIRAWQADVLFVPHPVDAHPDHRAVTRIVEDARFDAKLTKVTVPAPVDHWTGERLEGPGVEAGGAQTTPCYPRWVFHYYATHLRRVADPSFIIDVSDTLGAKMESIRAYRTQFVLPEKNRRALRWIEAAAVYFGSRIGTEAGEPFHSDEPLGLSGLDGVV